MITNKIIELKITLQGVKPSVYRTIQIENIRSFYDLHVAIQIAFGWENSHLHLFRLNNEEIGMSEFDEFEDQNTLEELEILLKEKIVFEKQKFDYIYDFGDNWEHKIEVVKFVDPKNTLYPKCIKGARNRPPEDCGGIWGFEEFKEIMGNRKHPEFKDMKTWYGGMYDEDYFSLSEVNDNFKNFNIISDEMLQDEDDYIV